MMEKLGQLAGKVLAMIYSVIASIFYRWERVEITNVSDYANYDEEITIDVYSPRLAKTGRRLTIIHPILTGDNYVSRVMANWFAIWHVRPCAIVHRGAYPFDANTPEAFENRLIAYFHNYRLAEGVMKDEGLLGRDTEVVSIGTSMGGFVNAYLAAGAAGSEYQRYISLMTGNSIIRTMAASKMERFEDWFEEQKRYHGWSRNETVNNYLETVKHDLMYYTKKINGEKFCMILSLFDKVVPYRQQKSLARRSDAQRRWTLPCGHATIMLLFPIVFPLLSWWTVTTSPDD